MTTEQSTLEERILQAVHEPAAVDVELLAHEIAASDDAQAYLVELFGTLTALAPESAPATRAAELLEHGMTIVAEHSIVEQRANEASSTRARSSDSDDER